MHCMPHAWMHRQPAMQPPVFPPAHQAAVFWVGPGHRVWGRVGDGAHKAVVLPGRSPRRRRHRAQRRCRGQRLGERHGLAAAAGKLQAAHQLAQLRRAGGPAQAAVHGCRRVRGVRPKQHQGQLKRGHPAIARLQHRQERLDYKRQRALLPLQAMLGRQLHHQAQAHAGHGPAGGLQGGGGGCRRRSVRAAGVGGVVGQRGAVRRFQWTCSDELA